MAELFAPDWYKARDKFIATARGNGNQIDAIPLTIDAGTYPIDVAWHGPKTADKLLLVTSGIHGVEGFAGSAIQLAFMKHQLSKAAQSDSHAYVFVHCVNPYGMIHWRRVNESNVDLNRNFFPEGHAYQGVSEERNRLEPVLNPKRHPYLRIDRLLYLILRYGAKTIHAVGEGQYAFPDSLFFGGFSLEQGPRKISRYLAEHLKAKKRIVHIDIHIGIGKKGQVQLFQTVPPSADMVNGVSRHMGKWLAFAHGQTTWKKQSVKYSARGIFNEAVKRCASGASLATFTLEFGSKGHVQLIKALRDENYIHQHGLADTEAGRKIKQRLFEYFSMNDARWRANVVNEGVEILSQSHRLLLD